MIVKCSGTESRMTGAGILGTVKKTLKGERPPENFIPLPQLTLPKTPFGRSLQENEWAEKQVFKVVFPLNPSTTFSLIVFFFFLSTLSWISLPTTQGALKRVIWKKKKSNLALSTRLPSCGQWGNQMPFRVLHQSGWDSGIMALAQPRLHCAKAHAAWSHNFLFEVCCIHGFRNQLDSGHWGVLEHQSVHAICS